MYARQVVNVYLYTAVGFLGEFCAPCGQTGVFCVYEHDQPIHLQSVKICTNTTLPSKPLNKTFPSCAPPTHPFLSQSRSLPLQLLELKWSLRKTMRQVSIINYSANLSTSKWEGPSYQGKDSSILGWRAYLRAQIY